MAEWRYHAGKYFFLCKWWRSGHHAHRSEFMFWYGFRATAGATGAVIFSFPPIILPTSLTPVSLGPDTAICPLGSIVLSTDSAFVTFVWQDGSTNPTFTVTDSGYYNVKAADTTGCFSADTVHIAFLPPYTFSMGMIQPFAPVIRL
jgi:hypothetical protein